MLPADEQTAQAERELADAAQAVDDLEETLDTLRDEHNTTLAALDESRGKLADTVTRHAADLQGIREQHAGEVKELKSHNE